MLARTLVLIAVLALTMPTVSPAQDEAAPFAGSMCDNPPDWILDEPDQERCEGRPVIIVEERYPDGTISSEQEFVELEDGEQVEHGRVTHFWPDGKKKMETSFVCGKRHGLKETWFRTGDRQSCGGYFQGQDHGRWTQWYPDGMKSREFSLTRGAWDGLYSVWHTNGQLRMQVMFVEGDQQGPLKMWTEDGALAMRVDYVDGVVQPSP